MEAGPCCVAGVCCSTSLGLSFFICEMSTMPTSQDHGEDRSRCQLEGKHVSVFMSPTPCCHLPWRAVTRSQLCRVKMLMGEEEGTGVGTRGALGV